MHSRIMETLEMLEERIENIKWLVTKPFSLKVSGTSEAIAIIRKSAGILGADYPKGPAIENKLRKDWQLNVYQRNR